MTNQFDPLFTPWKISNVEIKNRICMVPMAGTSLIDAMTGKPNKNCIEYYRERSENEVGLFIASGPVVAPFVGNKWMSDKKNPFLGCRETIDMIHKNGAKIFTQVSAGAGGRNFPIMPAMMPLIDNKFLHGITKGFFHLTDYQMLNADSDMPGYWDYADGRTAVQASGEVISKLAREIGVAAKYAKEAGIDGVEIHAMHFGYLMDQFALPYLNHRSDKYGEASWETRCRFAVEAVRSIKENCGEDYPVSMRLGMISYTKGLNQGALPGEEYTEVGRTLEDTIQCVKILEKAGVDVFDVDNGTYDSYYWTHPPVYLELNCNLKDAEELKKHTQKPVIVTGRMQPDAAAESISRNGIDGMGVGRQLLCDEAFAKKVKEGRVEDIRPCLGCNGCVPNVETGGHGDLSDMSGYGKCAQNPRIFAEKKYEVKQAARPKKYAVIGAGIGGVECALQLVRRGNAVDLYEKSGRIGGAFVAAAAPEFKEKDKDMLRWYEREPASSKVNVHFHSEVKSLSDIQADEYIIATGAAPGVLNCQGNGSTITATDYLLRKEAVGEKVAVIGGGLTGCEIAYELALLGKKPMVIEMQDRLMITKTVCAANTEMLRDELKFHQVPVYLKTKTLEINKDNIVIENEEGKQTIPVDSVITSIGFITGSPLAPQKNKQKNVHFIGDVKKVGNIKTAIYAANDLVLKLSK